MQEKLTIDLDETAKFSAMANDWWDVNGPCKILHAINPCRLAYIKSHTTLSEKLILDLGCGAGILTESLAKEKSQVTGIDASYEVIAAAKAHANSSNLDINYQVATSSDLAIINKNKYDVITCLELLEHLPDPGILIKDCTNLLKPGGKIFFSTLNRTLLSYATAVIGAEYLCKLLPKGTHDYAKFLKPAELHNLCSDNGIMIKDLKGVFYNPITNSAKISNDLKVNYIAMGIKV